LEVSSGFEWDDGNRAKCQKHGVSLEKIAGLFIGSVMIRSDIAHSLAETRFWPSAGADGLIFHDARDRR
jgi:uncharacterized DUF497 family protein